MLEQIRKHYLEKRTSQVDGDFLEFEEQMSSLEDKALIVKLLSLVPNSKIKLPNPHNSMILYCCGLTDEFDLARSRADTQGGAAPDIDLDFDALDVDRAIEWVVNHWGRDRVASIVAHGTLKPKSILRKWFAATEGSGEIQSRIKKLIPPAKFGKEATLEEILVVCPTLSTSKETKDFYRAAEKLEDLISHFGIHAAGLVISDQSLYDQIPLWSNKTSELISQYNKDELESLGLIKFDFLRIDTLSILKECCRLIRINHNIDLNLDTLEDRDPQTYALLAQGQLTGVFQMEASGKAKELVGAIKPSSIEELSDLSALNRPGPQQIGLDKQYVENKANGRPPRDMPKVVAELLKGTYWTLVYQEQVMELCSELAGFTLKEADDIRRAMGKKKKEVLEPYQNQFVEGCESRGSITRAYAEELWSNLVGFSDYGFNKSHSVSYAVLTYQTAWLKVHYSVEFFCALMTVRSRSLQPKDWAGKAPEYCGQGGNLGVEINPPSINQSDLEFTIRDREIYFGLNAIRDCGVTAARSVILARGNQPFKSALDFLQRVNTQKVNTKVVGALVKSGAFDRLGYNRQELFDQIGNLFSYVKGVVEHEERKIDSAARALEIVEREEVVTRRDQLKKESKKRTLTTEEQSFVDESVGLRRLVPLKLGEPPIPPAIEQYKKVPLGLREIMDQAQMIGCYIGQHPAKLINCNASELTSLVEGDRARVCGAIIEVKEIKTKNGQQMAFLQLDDSTAVAEVICFPKTWKQCQHPSAGDLVVIQGKLEQEEEMKFIADTVEIYRVAE